MRSLCKAQIAAEDWCEKHRCHLQMSCHAEAYLAGFKDAIEQAEKLAQDVGELLCEEKAVYLADLKALLEPRE